MTGYTLEPQVAIVRSFPLIHLIEHSTDQADIGFAGDEVGQDRLIVRETNDVGPSDSFAKLDASSMRGRSFKLIDQGFLEIRIDELEILEFEPLPKPSDDHARGTVQDTP